MEEKKEKKQRNKIIKIEENQYAELEKQYKALSALFAPKQKKADAEKANAKKVSNTFRKVFEIWCFGDSGNISVYPYQPTFDDCVDFFTRKENFEKWEQYKETIDAKVKERAEKAERGRKMAEARNAKNK